MSPYELIENTTKNPTITLISQIVFFANKKLRRCIRLIKRNQLRMQQMPYFAIRMNGTWKAQLINKIAWIGRYVDKS